MQQITIYDIAKLAGVSASTVSRVVNGNPNVKQSTRARVMKILMQYHYVPNETARGLVTHSSRMIGILISDIRITPHTDGIYYIEQELSRAGYSCLIYNTGSAEAKQAEYIQLLSKRKVDAAVFMGSIYQTEVVRKAVKTYLPNIPVIICNGYLEMPNIYGVIADEESGVHKCVQLLSERGRRHPAFIADHYTPSNCLKRKGYEEGMAQYFPNETVLAVEAGVGVEKVQEATRRLLREQPEVDGIIYSEDLLAAAGLSALAEKGLRVPADVAVIGINNSELAKICIPALTSLDNMLYDLGLTAARNILTLLEGQRVGKKMMICSEIVERGST